MMINRAWAMPNKRTFTIKPIKEIIKKYESKGLTLDPFPFPYKEDCLEYLKRFENDSADVILFDPPYSPRQLKECYDNQGMVLHDTKSSVWANWKDVIAKKIKVGGICLSFGWSSQGLGKIRDFEIIEILLVAHGGNHNDTIVTVERKVGSKTNENKEEKTECHLCKEKGVVFDGVDDAGHVNYYCDICGEPQND